MQKELLSIVSNYGLIPVVVIEQEECTLPLADAYLRAGLPIMEITLRTEAGIPAIERLVQQRPDVIVGAGSVLSLSQCKAAAAAGAQFIVSPGLDPDVAEYCLEKELCFIPGCVTPTEIESALKIGIKTVKFFPADIYGGAKGIASLHAPFQAAGLTFIPTGGVNLFNLSEYVALSCVAAVGGGWLCGKNAVTAEGAEQVVKTVRSSINRLLSLEFACGTACVDHAAGQAAVSSPQSEACVCRRTDWKKLDLFDVAGAWKEVRMGERLLLRTNSTTRTAFYFNRLGYAFDHITFVAK